MNDCATWPLFARVSYPASQLKHEMGAIGKTCSV